MFLVEVSTAWHVTRTKVKGAQDNLNIKRYLKIVGIEKHQRDINKPLRNKDD